MFDVYCDRCQQRVLLTTRRLLAIDNTANGIRLVWRCWRGHQGVLWTGLGRTEERTSA